MRVISVIALVLLFIGTPIGVQAEKPLSLVIMGYGGRAQWLLMKCLQQRSDITILAICDDNAQKCIDHMRGECEGLYFSLKNTYEDAIAQVELYPDTLEGMQSMLEKHADVDLVWVTSRNDRHLDHLTAALQHSACQKIFIEKPLFRTLSEWDEFDWRLTDEKEIVVGLTLRYSSMAAIVAEQLQFYKERLGTLREVKAWERLSFLHALSAFVLGSRRYQSLWGGLLLEKSIHDIDLALFFITSTGFHPSRITFGTFAENRFFTRSNEPQVLEYCGDNSALKNQVSEVLATYPLTGELGRGLIPDYHKVSTTLFAEGHEPVKFEVEADMSAYREVMERGTSLLFDHGTILVDVMASCMTIHLNDGTDFSYDLNTFHGGHADGDIYVVHAILNSAMPERHHKATILDPVVKLANIIALLSEDQAVNQKGVQEIYLFDDFWMFGDVEASHKSHAFNFTLN